jgi:gliding motility-associated lipoprotein GldH
MRLIKFGIIFLMLLGSLQSCNTIDVYEQTIPLPKQQWKNNLRLNFSPQIKDSIAYYNIYFVLRHSEAYHFNNIWINLTSTFPNDSARTQRLNIQLATGNGWLGTSMDDIIEQRLLLNKQPMRLRAGTYKFSIAQIMREDPLENILNAGIRIEKVTQ